MRYARDRSSVVSSRNTVNDDLYRAHQETMAQLVALGPIFDVCVGENGYDEGGRRREAWWQQEATEKQIWATLEGLS